MNQILHGHIVDCLRQIPNEGIHCIVTSPPYYGGLRKYGGRAVAWSDGSTKALGHEPTLEKYIEHLIEVFKECERVLHPSGSIFVNLGDTYVGRNSYFGFKPKDLMLVPHRFAIAMCDAGWYVRNDNVWNKPNAMPSSVEDRCARSHEYVYQFSKSPRYFFDHIAIQEDSVRFGKRNMRTVWNVPTSRYAGAHFAPFPEGLVDIPIKAGTSERGCCPKCLFPWKRLVERIKGLNPNYCGSSFSKGKTKERLSALLPPGEGERTIEIKTIGWTPTCACGLDEVIPCTVLDVFFGAGTTGLSATRLGRRWIGCELDPKSIALCEERLSPVCKFSVRSVPSPPKFKA